MTGAPDRLIAPKRAEEDTAELALRPQTLEDFIGQKQVRENLKIFIAAAKARGEALDHVLFHGPPGLGKTTLAQIVAREMGAGFRATSGPVIQKAGDLAAQLTNLQPYDVLFIDEIHRLNPAIEEVLYPAMEDFQLDLMIGEGPAARSVRIELPPFTLVGATTRSGRMTRPARHASPTGCSAACATSRPWRVKRLSTPGLPPTLWSAWKWTDGASMPWIVATSLVSPRITEADRSVQRRWRRLCPSSAT